MCEDDDEPRDERKKFSKLPRQLIHIKNADKMSHEQWSAHRAKDIANFPRPFICLLTAQPNCGKTNTIKNLLLHAKPMYDKIILCHADKGTQEYNDLEIDEEDCFWDSTLPEISFFENKPDGELWACVIEECNFNKANEKELSMLCRYLSTHKNISLFVSYQDFINIPKICRRLATVFVIWKPTDLSVLQVLEKKVGLQKGLLLPMFQQLCPHRRDSLCFDLTPFSPAPIRRNIFEKITKKEHVKEKSA